MAKARSQFICQNCGALSQRWLGKCEACNGWNCIVEEQVGSGIGAQAARGARKLKTQSLVMLAAAAPQEAAERARQQQKCCEVEGDLQPTVEAHQKRSGLTKA